MAARLVRELAIWMFAGACGGAALAAAWFLLPWLRAGALETPPVAWIAVGAAGAGIAIAIARALALRPRRLEAAKAWDDRTGAKDRLSSALELGAAAGPMAEFLREDAAREAARVEPRRVYPLTLPRIGWFVPIPLCAIVLCGLLPGWLRAEIPVNPHLLRTVANQAAQIRDYVAKEKGKELTKERREMLERLEKLASDLTRDHLRKKDALAEIAKLLDQMRKDKQDEEQKRKELEKLLRSMQAHDKQKDLEEDLNRGNYDDAANKIEEMIEKQRDEIRKRKENAEKPEDLKPLDDRVKELEKIKAQLMKLRLSKYNIDNLSEILDFLEGFEGDLGDLPEEEVIDGEPCQCQGACSRPAAGPIVRIARAPQVLQKNRAGRGTVQNIFGEETHNASTREEHKIRIRETKGKSAFTQTQVANDGSKSRLGAREVLAAERRAAEDTIQQQDVPAGYRSYILKYFEGIQPEAQDAQGK